jgi:hypothetical protein
MFLNTKNILTVKNGQALIFTAINLSNEGLNINRDDWIYQWTIDSYSTGISYVFNSLTNLRNVSITFTGVTPSFDTIDIKCRIIIPSNSTNPDNTYITKVKIVN